MTHGGRDTKAVEGAFIGAGIAALVAAFSGSKSVGAAALTGAAIGGALGAATPARRQLVVEFKDVVARVRAGHLAAA